MPRTLELKRRLLLPIAIGIIVLAAIAVGGYYLSAQHGLDEAFERKLEHGQSALHAMLDERGKKFALSAEIITGDRQLTSDLVARDRTALLQRITPLFERLRTTQQITHLYVHAADKTVFLRAHQPDHYGDIINRGTLVKAAETRQTIIGVELGTLGDLALRTVTPWFDGTTLIGFVEVGQEIAPIIGDLKRMFGLDAFAAIKKILVNRESFETGRRLFGGESHWNGESSVVVIYQTMGSTPAMVLDALEQGKTSNPRLTLTSTGGQRQFHLGVIPIEDANANLVGHVALLEDVTRGVKDVLEHARFAAMLAGAISLILIAAVFDLVYRAERRMAAALDQHQSDQSKRDHARLRTIEELENGALYDRVSTLPNRLLFTDRLAHHVHIAQREKQTFAVALVEIANHKPLLDTLGERLLDQLIQQIAFRMKEALRKSDTSGRYAEDQFGVVLPSVNLDIAVAMAQKLNSVLDTSYTVEDVAVDVRTAQGWALFPYHGQDVDTLLRRADTARRGAAEHHAEFEIFDSRKESAREQHLQLLAALQRAINNDEMQLHYLPRVDMRSRKVDSAEALLRWRHPEQGPIPPDEIIPLAETTGLVRQIAAWVTNRALRQQSQWRSAGIEIPISINLSTHNVSDDQFVAQVRQMFARWGSQPTTVTFEISEKSLTSAPKRVGEAIKQLQSMGCRIAVDDVGTGNSSLPYLKTLPVAEIKIDTSVIYTLPENQNNVAFLRSAIQLAHSLGIDVVAEGVKNKAIWDLLESMGCDKAQGYHICQPINSSAFECWLVNSKFGVEKRGLVCAIPVENE